MMTGLETIETPWLWMIGGALLGIAELLVPGVFLIWIGLAAMLTGVLTAMIPLPFAVQVIVFAVAAVVSIYAARRFLKQNPIVSTDPLLNDRGARMIGMLVTAASPVNALEGRVKAGDSLWSARGVDAQPGDKLRVTAVEGNILVVERA